MEWGNSNTEPEERTIDCGAFWPNLESKNFYDIYRVPSDMPAETVIDYLQQAVIRTRRALSDYKAEQEALGYAALADVPQEEVDSKKELVLLWQRAVFCEAKAEILKESSTMDRRKEAENKAKSDEETEDKYREFAQDAIRAIAGMERASIDLI